MYFNEDHEAFRAMMRKFVDNEINPYIDEWEEKGQAPLHDLSRKWATWASWVYATTRNTGARDWTTGSTCVFLEELGPG